ncbi:MAG: 3D domain-containing protein [Verrucomicrobiota bacterium]
MSLRSFYHTVSAVILAMVFSSCGTQNQLSGGGSSVFKPAPAGDDSEAKAQAIRDSAPRLLVVRTTAYSHQESDSWKYGKKNAAGGDLKHDRKERSAAADWSRFPLGTRFKIKGLSQEYVVDDYGKALVGSDTIDIYKPTLSSMKQWGTRHVGIEVLEWGSFTESERILQSRASKAAHVRTMLKAIQKKISHIPHELRNGFRVS